MKNVVIRALSGAVYVAIIIIAIFTGQWPMLALAILLMAAAITEFLRITAPDSGINAITLFIDLMTGASVLIPASLTLADFTPMAGIAAAAPVLCCLIVRLITELYLRDTNPVSSIARSLAAQVYITLPLLCMLVIYRYCGPLTVFMMFLLIWLNDTGAFCFGSLLGRHRLFERISPKKSWEGFWGGLAVCVMVTLISAIYWPVLPCATVPAVLFGVVVAVFATWGDLIESLIKRTVHVKDSGSIMPGHGGILDRIDSLLLVAPATLLYFILIN